MANKDLRIISRKREEPKIYSQSEMEKILEDYINGEIQEINWLPEEEYEKAKGQFRMQFGVLVSEKLEPLKMYGQKPYVEEAVNEILNDGVRLAEDFGLRVRGIDKIISLEIIRGGTNKFVFMSNVGYGGDDE